MGRRGVVIGMFAALVFTASLVGAFGVLFDATLRAHAPAVRYANATAVVARSQTISMPLRRAGDPPETQSRSLTERARAPLSLADRLRAEPGITSGSVNRLAGNTVALSSDVTGTFPVGSTITLWLGDGTRIQPRVVARYDRGLAFGDVLLSHDLLAAHTSSPLDDSILVRGGSAAELAPTVARYAGMRLVDGPGLLGGLSADVRLQGVANDILVVVIGGFTAIGVITTLALATLGRRRELALLRLVGATRGQVLRMLRWETVLALGTGIAVGAAIAGMTLIGFATAVFGRPLPTVPLGTSAAIVLTVAVLGSLAIALPARAVLHRPPAETIGVPE